MPRGENDFLIQRIEWNSNSNLFATVTSRFSNESGLFSFCVLWLADCQTNQQWKFIQVIFNCDLKYQNGTCQPAAWQKVQNGWLEKANSHFIPLEKGKFLEKYATSGQLAQWRHHFYSGILQIGECSVNRGQPYNHLQYVTLHDGQQKVFCLTQGESYLWVINYDVMSHMYESNISGLFEVTDILDYDPVRKEVYFMSTENPNLKPNEDEDPKLRRDFK